MDPVASLGNEKIATICAAIQGAVIERRLVPGLKLSEESLAGLFGCSRTIIRHAFQRLSKDRIITLLPNRGAFVSEPSVQEAHQIFDARKVVEDHTAALAAAKATRASIAKLRKLEQDERRAIGSGNRAAALRLSGELHLAIAEIAANAPMYDFLSELISRTSLILALYGAAAKRPAAGMSTSTSSMPLPLETEGAPAA
ncbi:MAG TPA: GntR family transcriptional regulator [Hyphomicrobiaceae bacterium]